MATVDEDVRSKIFNYRSINYIPTTFCGTDVVVTGLTHGKRKEIIGPIMESAGGINTVALMERMARVIIECVRYPDDYSKHVFNNNPADVEYINTLPPYEVDPIIKLAMALSGENREVIEAVIKNSKQATGPSTNTG
jgi:hypothetical protein